MLKFQLSSPICLIAVSGVYEGDYSIIVVCRDDNVYILKEYVRYVIYYSLNNINH